MTDRGPCNCEQALALAAKVDELTQRAAAAEAALALTMVAVGAIEPAAVQDAYAESLALRVIIDACKREGYDGVQPFASWIIGKARGEARARDGQLRAEQAYESSLNETTAALARAVEAEEKVALMDKLAQVKQALAEFYSLEGVEAWLIEPQRLLDGRVPRDVVAAGEEDKVLAVVEQLRTGAYV